MKQGLVLVIAVVLLFTTVRVSALTLQEGLGIVKEKSRDITISKAVEEQAREEVSLARSPLFPTLDVFATQTWLQDQPMAKFGPTGPASSVPLSEKEYQTVGFQVNQLVYDFGKTYSGLRASKYNVTLRETGTLRVGNSAALEFIEAYLDVLESEKMVQVDREEADRLTAHRRDAQALYDEGVVTRNDVLQAEVVLADAQQRLLTAENLRAVRASRINSILLKPLNEEVSVEEVSVSPSPGMGLEEAWNIAGQERPEIREIETAVRVKEEEQKAVKAEFFPTLYLSGGYKYEDNRYMVHEDNWSIVAGANINLSSGGATLARIRRAEAEIKELRLTRDKLLDTVRLEVKNAFLDVESARKRVEVTEKAVAQAEENLRLQKLRYEEGIGTSTDVLDAVALRTRSQSNYWTGLYSVKRAEARLQYSIGGDLYGIYGK